MPTATKARRAHGKTAQRGSNTPKLAARASALALIHALPDEAEIGIPEIALLRGKSVESIRADMRFGKLYIPRTPCSTQRSQRFFVGIVRKVLRGEAA